MNDAVQPWEESVPNFSAAHYRLEGPAGHVMAKRSSQETDRKNAFVRFVACESTTLCGTGSTKERMIK